MSEEITKPEGEKIAPLPSSTKKEEDKTDEAAEQLLMLSDFDKVTKLFRAGLQALGNENTGALATLNQLIKKAEILDQETREKILPMLGELKALLATSQEELKQFTTNAQKGLETQIQKVVNSVNFKPLENKVSEVNTTVESTVNLLNFKIAELEKIANRTKKMGFWASTKYLIAGMIVAISVGYGYSEIRTSNFEQNLQAQYDAKWNALESRFQLFKTQKSEQWNAVKMNDNGREYMQLVFRDGSKQVQCGWADTKQSGMGYPVSYINIPIYK